MTLSLDKYQFEAVKTDYRNTLVVSAPGSGKTTVIINRLKYLIEEKGVNPENIVVITFTRAAANNMKERYKRLLSGERSPFFGTFHGLFYKILKRHYGDINIIENKDSYKIINKVLFNYIDEISEEKIKEVLSDISRFKTSNHTREEFSPDLDKNIFWQCYDAYEGYKVEKGLWDFDDLQINCRNLFLNNPRVLEGYRRLFKHILVDEFQDCDGIQIEILKILNEDSSLFAVGDEDQCIYSFRGSRPDCMVDFHNIFEKGKKIYLSYNYRSAKNIIEVSKNLIKHNKMRNEKNIESYRTDEKLILSKEVLDENSQSEDISNRIMSYKEVDNINFKDNAILYRTNFESRSIIDSFIRKKIPFLLLDKEYNFFHHFICQDIISYLKLSIDTSHRESFFRIINKPFRYISKVNLEKLRKYAYKEDCFEILKNLGELPNFQMRTMDELRRDILSLNKMSLNSAIDFIIMDIGYIDYLKEYSKKFKLNLDELEEILQGFKDAAEGYNNIISFLAHIEVVEEEIKNSSKKKSEDAVVLSTIHGVKGMEFKNVYIMNCNEDFIPHINSKDNHIEEERRLFYVGITRAIDNLHIYSTKYLRGKSREVSRFIEECKLKNVSNCSVPYKKGDKIYHVSFKEGIIKEMKNGEIDIEFSSGVVRKFNFDILYMNKLIKKIS